jgi:RNA polymerase sigma factor (sigma-70 family)
VIAPDPEDARLVQAARAGDQRASAAIVNRHKAALHALVTRITGDGDAALDIVQEAYVAAFGALDRYDPARPLRAWLARIAINKARDWQRRRSVRRFLGGIWPGGHDAASDTPGADRIVSGREEVARLQRALDSLPSRLREVIVLRTIEGLDQAETAALLGISAKAVETRLYRARRSLAALMHDDR